MIIPATHRKINQLLCGKPIELRKNFAKILQIEHQTTIANIFELLISENIDFTDYKSNLKYYAENSWISADVIEEYIDKGEEYGR